MSSFLELKFWLKSPAKLMSLIWMKRVFFTRFSHQKQYVKSPEMDIKISNAANQLFYAQIYAVARKCVDHYWNVQKP